tara:strand:+ start:95 stop:526 length:432 start_codon:yes stop_codon:yes gene_type:complete
MINVNTYHKYIAKLKIDIENWINTNDYKDWSWSEEISSLPLLLDKCLDIYDMDNIPSILKTKAEGVIEYAESDFDHLSEAILGNRGLADDLFIAALYLKESNEVYNISLDTEIINKVDYIISISKKMLGESTYHKCQVTYKNF